MAEQPIFKVTYIPQDIKLELNNGTLTLKSGSIITAPDGTQLQVTADKTRTQTSNGQYMIFASNVSGNIAGPVPVAKIGSGSSVPADNTNFVRFFNTSNQKFYTWSSSNQVWQLWDVALPVCVMTVSGGQISSIDQVFNGFGYFGSSLFMLPDVEGFYPNGKDGFENIFRTIKQTRVVIFNPSGKRTDTPVCFTNGAYTRWSGGFEIVDKLPSKQEAVGARRYYNRTNNINYYHTGGGSFSVENYVPFGYYSTESSSPYRITELKIVNPFAITDIYEYQYASSKPLSQYANSPKFLGLYDNICGLFNNARTLEDWFNIVFNLKTASGYGLDVWGVFLNQDRQFSYVENGVTQYIYLGGEQTIGGETYSAEYMEEMYRMVLFLKALCCITNCTLASLNNLLQSYFNKRVYVINYGTMEIRYVFEFYVSNLEKAIFTTEFLPRPTGVLANFEYIPLGGYFGFFVNGIANPTDQPYAPFDNKPFYR